MMKFSHAIELNGLDVNSNADKVVGAFNKFSKYHRNELISDVDYYIFRARLEDSEFSITKKQELSYIHPKSGIPIRIRRANPIGVPVFYGATNPSKQKGNQEFAIQTAILECSNNRRNRSTDDFEEYGYLSRR